MPTKSQNVEGSNADEKTGEVSTSGCPATESNAIPAILQWLDKNQSGSAKLRIQLVNKQVYVSFFDFVCITGHYLDQCNKILFQVSFFL